MKRTLTLKRERLVELDTDQLASVQGGQLPTLAQGTTCLTDMTIHTCPGASCGCCTASASC